MSSLYTKAALATLMLGGWKLLSTGSVEGLGWISATAPIWMLLLCDTAWLQMSRVAR